MAQDAQLYFAYYRSELARPGDAVNLYILSQNVAEPWRDAAFNVNACSLVLNKKIGGWRVHRDHSSNVHGVANRRLLRT